MLSTILVCVILYYVLDEREKFNCELELSLDYHTDLNICKNNCVNNGCGGIYTSDGSCKIDVCGSGTISQDSSGNITYNQSS